MEPSPPLTRFDVVMGVLRVQLWLSVIALIVQVITSAALFINNGYIVINAGRST